MYKKTALFFSIGVFAVMCTSCAVNSPVEVLTEPVSAVSKRMINIISDGKRISFPQEEVFTMGKTLLEEYDVQPNQTLRFPFEEYVFQTHGDKALTSIEEARSKYPDCCIPEKLGKYTFVDFTLYPQRTSFVDATMHPLRNRLDFPDSVPPPSKDKIEVLTDKEALQYYLCYQKGDSRFNISVMPMYPEIFAYEDIADITRDFIEWESHPRGYYIPVEENNTSLFQGIWISSEPTGKYNFFIHKISGADCLESDNINFTEDEAHDIYQAILKNFPN